MDAIPSSFEVAMGKALGQAMGGVIVLVTLLIFISVFVFVLYFYGRKKGLGFQINLGSGDDPPVAPTPASRAAAAPPRMPSRELPRLHPAAAGPETGRKEFLKKLDSVERVVATIYMLLLFAILIAATAAMAWVWLEYPDDGNRDFMLFYCGVIYLVGVLALINQILATSSRLVGRDEPSLMAQLRSKIQVNVQGSPDVGFIDAAALERARRHMAGGGSLDEACALIDPRYRQMSGWRKEVFRKAVEMALASKT